MKKYFTIAVLGLFSNQLTAQKINRKALVERHTVVNKTMDTLSSLSVGNGKFAFTVDATGLQSFPDAYAKGVPLGTQSEWGWHSFPNTKGYKEEEALKTYHLNGRDVQYMVQWNSPEQNKIASNYFRVNLHRLHLANIGLEIVKKDGTVFNVADVKNIDQTLNLYNGEVHSKFTVDNVPVEVITFCHQQQDAIGVKINSALILEGKLSIRIRLPYPTGGWADMGNNFKEEEKHQSSVFPSSKNSIQIRHELDSAKYYIGLSWKGKATYKTVQPHYYLVTPHVANSFEFSCNFFEYSKAVYIPSYEKIKSNSISSWASFWQRGAAVDFAGSTDKRAKELERRIVLSQYLTKIQCEGSNPPQETGLTYNSWYGKPHIEMHWWHAVHFALWGRVDLLENTMAWYDKVAPIAKSIAQRQGYDGVRWQKMTDNDGREVPSSVGAFLIWQQPHYIYFTELIYRQKSNTQTLNKYKDLVFATADFMASFARYDSATKKYVLGKGLIAAQERFKADTTYNPTYELAYWHWALSAAQQWRERLHLLRNKKWDDVIKNLSPLPIQGDKYLFTESAGDSYTNPEFKTDHPSVLGALGMAPETPMVNKTIMQNTFNWIWDNWSWKDTWGWDFPMTAMTATRLGNPDKAIDALLMNITTNTYLNNGHNYQDDRLTIYLPGNGGILAAVAMMCAGYDGSTIAEPGIPKNGKWKVKWEGLKKML
jgi:protein-glucosylgalactosylhydroxylysine glucosidase